MKSSGMGSLSKHGKLIYLLIYCIDSLTFKANI